MIKHLSFLRPGAGRAARWIRILAAAALCLVVTGGTISFATPVAQASGASLSLVASPAYLSAGSPVTPTLSVTMTAAGLAANNEPYTLTLQTATGTRVPLNNVQALTGQLTNGTIMLSAVSVPANLAAGVLTLGLVVSDTTLVTTSTVITVAAPSLTLNPSSGVPGQTVAASGAGFYPGEAVQVKVNNTVQMITTASVSGTVSASVSMPLAVTPPAVTVGATGGTSQVSAAAVYTVVAVPQITAAYQGGLIGVSGQGFGAGETVVLTLDGTQIQSTTANGGGGFNVANIQTALATNGSHTLVARGVTTGLSATFTLVISGPSFTCSTTSAVVGATVTCTADGYFSPNESVQIRVGSVLVATVTADNNGNLTNAPFVVPALPGGVTTLLLTGLSSQHSVQNASFLILPSVSLSQTSAVGGTGITISGVGVGANQGYVIYMDYGTAQTVQLATGASNGAGAYGPVTFVVPVAAVGGQHTVSVFYAGNLHTDVTFTVLANVVLFPSRIVGPGATVALTATGFGRIANGVGQLDTIYLYLNNHLVATGLTTAQGQLNNLSFTVPATTGVTAGSYGLIVLDTNTSAQLTAPLIVGGSLVISPSAAGTGGIVTVTGSGFAPNENVAFQPSAGTAVTVPANASGVAAINFTIPSGVTSGVITMVARGLSSGLLLSSPITVSAALNASVAMGTAGSAIVLNGSGFAPNEQVSVAFGASMVGSVMVNAQGGFANLSVVVPSVLPFGHTTIVGTGATSHLTASTGFTVTAALALQPGLAGAVSSGITFSGSGWAPYEYVTLQLGTTVLTTVPANVNGQISGGFTVPNLPVGAYALTAHGAASNQTVLAGQFTVTGPAIPTHLNLVVSPQNVVSGGAIVVGISGALGGETISVLVDGTTLTTLTANASGSAGPQTIGLPPSLAAGSHTILVVGQRSNARGQATISIAPTITVSSATVAAGSGVTVTGTGFAPNELIGVFLAGLSNPATTPGTITTNAQGGFSAQVTLAGATPAGKHSLIVTGATSHASANVLLMVTPLIVLHPTTWYFAAGDTTAGWQETVALVNPNAVAASGVITFVLQSGGSKVYPFTLPPNGRTDVNVNSVVGNNQQVSMVIWANQRVPAMRTITLGTQGAAASAGVGAPARTWYLAEGYTGQTFQEQLSLFNPGATAAHVQVHLVTFNGLPPANASLTLPPLSRTSIDVNRLMPRRSVSAFVTSDQPIVTERVMVFGTTHQGISVATGASAPAGHWFFAQGSTVNGFETYLTIVNPTNQTAGVTIRFRDSTGKVLAVNTLSVTRYNRVTVVANRLLHADGFTIQVDSTQGIVVERPLYSASPNSASAVGSVIVGRPSAAAGWVFASGDTSAGSTTRLFLFNPTTATAQIAATYYTDRGTTVARSYTIPAEGRVGVNVNLSVAGLGSGMHSVVLHTANGVTFVAEQNIATYGRTGGSEVLGTPQ